MHRMVTIRFLLHDSLEKIGFFEEIFLFSDTNIKVTLRITNLLFSNTDIVFVKKPKKFI